MVNEKQLSGFRGQTIPNIDSEVVEMVSSRYIELYEKLLKKIFSTKIQNINERIYQILRILFNSKIIFSLLKSESYQYFFL